MLEVLKVYGFRVMLVFVMYYIYVTSGSSLLIESTDSMIIGLSIILPDLEVATYDHML